MSRAKGNRGNWWFLLVALSLGLTLTAVVFGGHVYRWEMIVWLVIGITSSVMLYIDSRRMK